jgi:hypothetical protein
MVGVSKAVGIIFLMFRCDVRGRDWGREIKVTHFLEDIALPLNDVDRQIHLGACFDLGV